MFPCRRPRVRKLFTGLLATFTLVFLMMLILKRYDRLTAQLPRSQKHVMVMSERTAHNDEDATAPKEDLTPAMKEQISEIKEEKKQDKEKNGREEGEGAIVDIMEDAPASEMGKEGLKEEVREKTRVAPTIKKEMEKAPVKKEEAPAKKEEAPVKKEESPVKKEETPVKKEEPLAKKEETPVKKEEPPVKKEEETPVQKEEPLVKKEEKPVKKEESPVKKEEETPVKKEEPLVKKEETPVKKEEPLVKKEETPVKKEEPPVKKEEETPVKKEEPPVKKEETPVKKEESPVKKEEETPVKKEEPPVKKEETPVKKEESPVKKEEEIPVKKEEPPVKKEETPVKKEESPVKKEEETPVKKEEPLAKKEEETPVKKEEPLVKKEETPVKKEESPVKKEEETPVKKEEPPVKKEETPVKKEEPLVKKEAETPVKKEESPVKKEEETQVKKEESPVKKGEESPVKKEEAESKKESQNMAPLSAIKAPETQKEKQAAPHVITDTGKAKTIMPVTTLRTPVLTIIPPDLDPSYIGDVYSQQENPFQTTDCPNSIRKKMMGTDFRRVFLKDVPVLQWKPHATVEEYARLRGYNGCFGWNVTSWDDIKETLALLNTSANGYIFSDWNRNRTSASPCIRCAVVGNGGILRGSKKGKEIDQHDYVFRVNGAILQGYEEDVGNHTSFYVFSTNTMMNSLYEYGQDGFRKIPQLQDTSYIFIPDNDRDFYMVKATLMRSPVDRGGDIKKLPSDFFGQNYTTEQFKVFHPDFMRYLRNRFLLSELLRTEYANVYRPSTGASMLLAAVHSCDEVSAYGFITPDYNKYSDHYFDKSKKEVMFYVNHDYLIEIDLWQRLHNQGIIKLYSRS